MPGTVKVEKSKSPNFSRKLYQPKPEYKPKPEPEDKTIKVPGSGPKLSPDRNKFLKS